MKIILTSKGFENEIVFNKIISKINMKISEIKMLVIPTARKNEYNKEKYMKDYIKLGFNPQNIYFFDDEMPEKFKSLI